MQYKRIKSIFLPGLLLIMAVSGLQGCGAGGAENKMPGFLYVRLQKNPTTLDPALIVDLDGARIAAKLYSCLVTFDENLLPVPDAAECWTVSPDGRSYVFRLKQGNTFFNGRQLTAADVVYSFERVLNPKTKSPRTWVLSRIQGARQFMDGQADHVAGIRQLGPLDVLITLEEPFAPFICFLGLTTASIVPREEVETWGADYGFHGSGAGPFCLERWRHNQFLTLKANKEYGGRKPGLAGICYKIIPEDFTALAEFETGDIDLLPEIMLSAYSRYAGDPAWQPYIKMTPGLNTYYLGLNCRMAPFTDVRVRQAMNFAIDREKMFNTIFEKRGTLASGPLPPLLRGGPSPEPYGYSPARAKKLLAEAGYPDGFSMTIYQTADMENLDICQVIQGYLKQIGIDVSIVQLEWSTFLDTVARGEAQSFWLSWWADYPEGENFLFPLFCSRTWGAGGNRCRFANKDIDGLLYQSVTIPDGEARRAAYRFIEKKIVREAPWVFFWHKSSCSIHRPRVQGYRVSPLASMEKWNEIYLSTPVQQNGNTFGLQQTE